MNKRIALFCLLLLLPLALFACGGGSGETSDAPTETEATTESSAQGNAGIAVVDVTAKRGDLARVTISIKENPGFEGANLRLYYDADVLTPVSATGPSDGLFVSNAAGGAVPPTMGDTPYVSLVWAAATAMTEDGEIFTVTFRVREGGRVNTTLLSLGIVELQKGGEEFTLPLYSGQIQIFDEE